MGFAMVLAVPLMLLAGTLMDVATADDDSHDDDHPHPDDTVTDAADEGEPIL